MRLVHKQNRELTRTSRQYTHTQLAQSLPVVVGMAYEHQLFCVAAGQSSCDQKKKIGSELWRVIGLHQILAGNVTHNYYMLGITTELSMPFQVLGLWLHLRISSS